LDLTNFEILKDQVNTLVEVHEGAFADFPKEHKIIISFEYMEEYTKPFIFIEDVKYEQVVLLHFENELKIGEIEHGSTFNHKAYPCIFTDFQDEVMFHVFEDLFASMFQSS